jgi:hypothetical protein
MELRTGVAARKNDLAGFIRGFPEFASHGSAAGFVQPTE